MQVHNSDIQDMHLKIKLYIDVKKCLIMRHLYGNNLIHTNNILANGCTIIIALNT